jgi:hypothetical protein
MKKKKVELATLGKAHTKEHFKTIIPYLRKDYRPLLKSELKSKEVFIELFGAEKFDENKLKTVYAFQNL